MGRSLCRAALLATLLQLGCGCGDERPALLLITIETLRPDRLACYGGDPEIGTGICALANQGTRFVWSLSAAPATAPSIASILTSSWPSSHGVTELASTALPEQAQTLAELLREAGYDTAAFVANPVLRRGRHFEQGFAIYDDRMTRREPNRPELLEREAGEVTDAALAWLRVARRPWFLWIHYQDPHGPYLPPHPTRRRDPPDAPLLPMLSDHSGYQGIPAYQALPGLRSLPAYEDRYRDEIRHVDLHAARLVAEADGLGPRPWVVITADHGEAFGEDGYYFAHGHSVAIDQIRVPLILRPPDPAPARISAPPVSGVDIAPTLLRAARLSVPDGFLGKPLPVRAEQESEGPRTLIAEHRARAAIVVGSTYYARDRARIEPGTPDAITGGALRPLPPRLARLEAEGSPPAYRLPSRERAARLESLLASFLRSSPAPAPSRAPELTESDREVLRALGYLE